MYQSLIKPIAFKFDPEFIHEKALWLLSHGLIRARQFSDPRLVQQLFGVSFPNPLGLAAGFDKNGVAINEWHRLGFGFVEIGTVTPKAQPGNPKPRMFRLPAEQGLINRLGFNNRGAEMLAARMAGSSPVIPIGVNLGKNKTTPAEGAADDYRTSFQRLHSGGDYFVINVSSPNTPGLRDLQEKGPLLEIVAAIRDVDESRPLFVKVAPDLEFAALDELLRVAIDTKLTGIIATNTTIDRAMLREDPGIPGGLSGGPLRARSNEVLAHLYRHAPKSLILVGVGGILSGDDLFEKIALGAHLCQVYTGWIYGGPSFAPCAVRRLLTLMDERGFASLADLRGSSLA